MVELKPQTKKNNKYREKHDLTRLELLVSKVTRVRFEELKKSTPSTTANQLLTMLLDAYQSPPSTTSEPLVVVAESTPSTVLDPVEVIPISTPSTAIESIPQPQDISRDTVKAIAQRLLEQHGMNKAAALKPTREAWKKLFPDWKCDRGTKSELQSKYNSLDDQMKAIVKKLSTNQ